MYCPKCGNKVDETWEFCSKCGFKLLKPIQFDKPMQSGKSIHSDKPMQSDKPLPSGKPLHISGDFSINNIFESLNKDMGFIKKQFEKDIKNRDRDIEFFNITPFNMSAKPNIKKSGFSISIKTGSGMKPIVNIRTIGDVDKAHLEKEIANQFGIRVPKSDFSIRKDSELKEDLSNLKKIPTKTEEPEINIKRLPTEIIIETNLPDVKSVSDIEIKRFKESIEIRALTQDKLYFKIIQIPEEWRLEKKEFKDGKLRLELVP